MKKPHILIVDDFEDSREMYGVVLSEEGFQVDSAADGREGLDKAARLSPDVILMDLSLPDIDGWEAIRRLKQGEQTKHIPVVLLTAYDLPPTPVAGCDGVLIKPCRPDKMVAEIRRLLGPASRPGASKSVSDAAARSPKA
jgi:two-component system, cell cycle response regulator DivK